MAGTCSSYFNDLGNTCATPCKRESLAYGLGFVLCHGLSQDHHHPTDWQKMMRLTVAAFVGLVVLVATSSCQTPSFTASQGLTDGFIYKRDMRVCFGDRCATGVLVAPKMDIYQFKVEAFGDLDLFTMSSCHREETTTEHKGKWIFENRKVEGQYVPEPKIESGYCPLYIGGYDKKGRHSWAFVDFETEEKPLNGRLYCNGQMALPQGVSVCQSRAGLLQAIEFAETVTVGKNRCGVSTDGTTNRVEMVMPKGECVVVFFGSEGRRHRLTLIGYDQIIVRGR